VGEKQVTREWRREISWGEAISAAFFFSIVLGVFAFCIVLLIIGTNGWALAALVPLVTLTLLFKYTRLGQIAL
jgi:hypothetical protein